MFMRESPHLPSATVDNMGDRHDDVPWDCWSPGAEPRCAAQDSGEAQWPKRLQQGSCTLK